MCTLMIFSAAVPGCYALAIHSVGGPRDEGEEEDTLDTDEEGES